MAKLFITASFVPAAVTLRGALLKRSGGVNFESHLHPQCG